MVRSAFPNEATTSETEWVSMLHHQPELALSTRRVVVVAPHPDDETLAVGGLLAELVQRQVEVTVVAVTDGEGSHPDQPGLASRRRREQEAACAALGIDVQIERLHLPDRQVAEHIDVVASLLDDRCDPDTVLVAPWEHDGHSDHDACGRAARRVATSADSTLLAYPVWAWQWADPQDLEHLSMRKITLSAPSREAKDAAIACYRSQTTDAFGPPILTEQMLRRFHRPHEAVLHVQ